MNGQGELVASRRPTTKEETDASQYLPCSGGLGWYHSHNLQLHPKTCPVVIPQDNNQLRNGRMLIAPFITSEKNQDSELFSQMKETKKYPRLRQLSEDDVLIREFAKGLLQKLGTKEEQRLKDMGNIRTKVRHVASLLEAAKEDAEITDLESVITPNKFVFVVATGKCLSSEYDSPKLASTLGRYLKQLSMLKKSLALIAGDEINHKVAVDFDTLFDAHVSVVANRRLKLRTLNKDTKIPPTNDLRCSDVSLTYEEVYCHS